MTRRIIATIDRDTPPVAHNPDRACKNTDPELFFPDKYASSEPAKTICRRCPVTTECLNWALATDQRWGVWGATTPYEREQLKKRRSIR